MNVNAVRDVSARSSDGVSSTRGRAGLPSSARRSTSSADEDASLSLLGDDDIGLADVDEWPDHFGAALLGIP